MTAAYFEDHPTDPDKVIFRKPPLDQGPDYERGFVDGMLYQTQSSVYKAVSAMSKRTWVGMTEDEAIDLLPEGDWEIESTLDFAQAIEAKLKDKNGF